MLLGSDVDYEPLCTPFNITNYKFHIHRLIYDSFKNLSWLSPVTLLISAY